ncbi:hypothetical protein AVEN_98855-1 [Araneus ventricosus]|uniref:Tc1-like transposase DDE domain-containing protein n=1 Tax=Araneus ventricosus TaxID=182803 RepID=A0A4Y2LKY5_ARAVE|nr:hypothetical protein AVEN_98855-1 [Araneus ventricosus]
MRIVNIHHPKIRVNAGLNGLGNRRGQFYVFGWIWRVWCIMSFWYPAKPSIVLATNNNISSVWKYALVDKRPQWTSRHDNVILLRDNASPYTSKPVKNTLKDLVWEVFPHPLYSPEAPKEANFNWDDIHTLLGIWGKCVASNSHYFE